MNIRQHSLIDNIIVECDKAIRTIIGKPDTTIRSVPGHDLAETNLTSAEQILSMRLMRVNHSGEVAAQALYQGQALTATLPEVRQAMEQAALEENDHLTWCQQRVEYLDSHTSILTPLWYIGSFTIGAIAGRVGDKWSLGFVAETEKQVVEHIDEHLAKISPDDHKSRAILEQMKIDELHHCTVAQEAGASELPKPIKMAMGLMSKVMTKSSYWL
ncbi:MAG: demethoxyubiquinone hydroxylase family protein [Methylophaga sp.]|nr:MAG: demethoxyubiquinone hydroxylase family protein [Methylophaga sp.]